MECCTMLIVALVLVCVVGFFLLDCDLTLYLKTKFGKSPKELQGKVVWITGASAGIGEYLAYELAKYGCRLVLSARREEELQKVKKQCLLCGKLKEEDVLVLKLDVLDFNSHEKAVQDVLKHFKQIDILVNNAGRSQRGLAINTELEVDRQLLDLNVLSVVSLTKKVLPHMVERKSGHIVVTSSVAGKLGAPFSAAYSASKFAIQGWFDALRIEENENNISVTLVCPGPVGTDIGINSFSEKAGQDYGENPTDKRMTVERCAELMAYAIANKSYEIWVSNQPILLVVYLTQYLPTVAKSIMCAAGMKTVKRVRAGRPSS